MHLKYNMLTSMRLQTICVFQVLLWVPLFANLYDLYDEFHDPRIPPPQNSNSVGLNAKIENCSGCRYDHYSPSSSNIIHESIDSTSCIPRLKDHANITVFHSAKIAWVPFAIAE